MSRKKYKITLSIDALSTKSGTTSEKVNKLKGTLEQLHKIQQRKKK